MRTPSKKLMRIDFIIQMLLMVPMGISLITGLADLGWLLLAAFIMFFLGIWQVLSSLYANAVLGLKSRRIHLVIVVLLFCGVGIFSLVFPNFRLHNTQETIAIAFCFIVPIVIAIYYARVTYLDYQGLDDDGRKPLMKDDLDGDILDAGF